MAPDLSAASFHTPQRPRAATTVLPAMPPPSPQSRQYNTTSPIIPQGSPPVGSGEGITSTAQGPLRHPKPLTPSDLHLVLEKEQEAMVNRLTRELSLLRQQTTSVASTTSSTSTFNDPADMAHASPSLTSSTHPHSHTSRRQRSSSSLSAHASAAQGPQAASVTGIALSRDRGLSSSRPAEHTRGLRSRESSLTSRRPSFGSLSSFSQHPHHDHPYSKSPSLYPNRNSVSQTQLVYSPASSMSRYEETAHHKSELDSIKRENEQLRKRVRDLEDVLKKSKGESMSETGASDLSL
ncbi:hypothetical protein NUU61_002913 [Penicillium alfredii]|uniref:Uncharacterized protein n=1 Tax=Penicillium alfredii TaxID=1506179 RepID=A0A9W9FSD3_9EURO|nr:uncharacterized protein NUU61_002913 [Penicillium alfredii]KAJ5105566.1 hypothetical protein NUU61_002913 [Penicillium alfredii]